MGRMLYDHKVDSGETVNIVKQPSNARLARELDQQLREGMGKLGMGGQAK